MRGKNFQAFTQEDFGRAPLPASGLSEEQCRGRRDALHQEHTICMHLTSKKQSFTMQLSFDFKSKWSATFTGTDKDTHQRICLLVSSNDDDTSFTVTIQTQEAPTHGRFGNFAPTSAAPVADPSINTDTVSGDVEEATTGNCVDLTGNNTSAFDGSAIDSSSGEEDEDVFDEEIAVLGHGVEYVEIDSDEESSADECEALNGYSQNAFGFAPPRRRSNRINNS